jgi:hypothetical protein
MGGSVKTGTQTTGINNADVNATISKLAKGIGAEYSPGKSLFQAPGATTQQGWQSSLTAAGNPDYASGLSSALSSYGRTASGAELGQNDPGYATLRAKLSNDVLQQTNSSFNNSGLFGSDSNQRAAASGLTDSLGALDYKQYSDSRDRQNNAALMLPQLFQAAQLPGSIQASVGASQDAAAQGAANGPTDYLAKLSSIANGNAANAGTTTSKEIPWWSAILAGATGLAGVL